MNLPIMHARLSMLDKVCLLQTSTTNKTTNFTQWPILHPARAQLLDQLGEAAHWSASSSATIASMEARSSRWRSTMPAIRVFNSTMSTCSRVSSGST